MNDKDYKGNDDAFGHILWDYYFNHEDSYEVIERSDGFVDVINPRLYFTKYTQWLDVEKRAMKFVSGKRLLDVGCGAGRHALFLQEKGFDALGIDSSPLAIKICQQRGLKKARIDSITRYTTKLNNNLSFFDTILMLGNNFGLMGSFKGARKILCRFYRITSNNAIIIAQSMDPYMTKERAHIKYHGQNRQKSRMSGQARIRVRYKDYKSKWFDYLFVSKKEIKDILNGTGWRTRCFLDSKSARHVYIAIIEKE
jgi:ubiquinone/menaquinone biosynthesis C-methylase UbiE